VVEAEGAALRDGVGAGGRGGKGGAAALEGGVGGLKRSGDGGGGAWKRECGASVRVVVVWGFLSSESGERQKGPNKNKRDKRNQGFNRGSNEIRNQVGEAQGGSRRRRQKND